LLEAQGNKVFMSPPGPDGGIDLLAGKGDFGFEEPLLAVQVKSGNEQVGTMDLNQLGGVISKVGATHGLLVSWSGFKGSASKELANSYFKIRFWDSSDIIELIQHHYERLPDDIKADIPLRRIWTLVPDEDE
jgi:restriction system protein